MKVTEVKFRNSIAMPDTNTGNTEKIRVSPGTTLELLQKIRCIAITKAGYPLTVIVPLEQVAWMKVEPETTEPVTRPDPPKTT
jgi:hypothetical protein